MISRPRSEGQFTQDSSHSKVVHNLLFQGMGRWWVDKESQLPREKKKRVIRAASLLRVEFDPLRLAIQSFKRHISVLINQAFISNSNNLP